MFRSRRYIFRKTVEDVPSASKHVEDNVTIKILLYKGTFCWFILHDYSTTQRVENNKYKFYILKLPMLQSLTFHVLHK